MSTDTMESGILEAIDAIRPALQADGGDIVFKDDRRRRRGARGARGCLRDLPGVDDDAQGRRRSGSSWTGCRASPKSSPTERTRGRSTPARSSRGRSTGDRGAVAKLISLVESGGPAAVEAVARCSIPHTGGAYTVGLTGRAGRGEVEPHRRADPPAPRATDIEVGVLAIDPTSPFSGGAILGDRVRMQDHAIDAGVYIRSMATRGHLGGLALATPLAARVLDAAGKPWMHRSRPSASGRSRSRSRARPTPPSSS